MNEVRRLVKEGSVDLGMRLMGEMVANDKVVTKIMYMIQYDFFF